MEQEVSTLFAALPYPNTEVLCRVSSCLGRYVIPTPFAALRMSDRGYLSYIAG